MATRRCGSAPKPSPVSYGPCTTRRTRPQLLSPANARPETHRRDREVLTRRNVMIFDPAATSGRPTTPAGVSLRNVGRVPILMAQAEVTTAQQIDICERC